MNDIIFMFLVLDAALVAMLFGGDAIWVVRRYRQARSPRSCQRILTSPLTSFFEAPCGNTPTHGDPHWCGCRGRQS